MDFDSCSTLAAMGLLSASIICLHCVRPLSALARHNPDSAWGTA